MSQPLRVLQMVQGLDIGRRYGGAERAGAELALHFRQEGLCVSLCAFWREGTSAESYWVRKLESAGVQVIFASARAQSPDPREFWRAVRHLTSLVAHAPMDVVHAHHDGGALAGLVLKYRGHARAVIHTTHIPIQHQWGFGTIGWLCRLIFTNGLFPLLLDAEVTIIPVYLKSLAQRPLARLLRKRHYLIYNNLPSSFDGETARQSKPLTKKDHWVIGSVGRLSAEKGYYDLLEAIPHVLVEFPHARFVLVGDGDLRLPLNKRARELGVQKHITFAGQQENTEPFYRQMDLFVLPSPWEGVSTVVLESIASGVPVVAIDIPGNRALITPSITGWLVPPADSLALANAMIDALRDPERAARYAQSAKTILSNFSSRSIARKYTELYHTVLKA